MDGDRDVNGDGAGDGDGIGDEFSGISALKYIFILFIYFWLCQVLVLTHIPCNRRAQLSHSMWNLSSLIRVKPMPSVLVG